MGPFLVVVPPLSEKFSLSSQLKIFFFSSFQRANNFLFILSPELVASMLFLKSTFAPILKTIRMIPSFQPFVNSVVRLIFVFFVVRNIYDVSISVFHKIDIDVILFLPCIFTAIGTRHFTLL